MTVTDPVTVRHDHDTKKLVMTRHYPEVVMLILVLGLGHLVSQEMILNTIIFHVCH